MYECAADDPGGQFVRLVLSLTMYRSTLAFALSERTSGTFHVSLAISGVP